MNSRIDIRCGDYRQVLADVRCDAVLVDLLVFCEMKIAFMDLQMLASGKQLQVFDSIISRIFVQMMNYHPARNRSVSRFPHKARPKSPFSRSHFDVGTHGPRAVVAPKSQITNVCSFFRNSTFLEIGRAHV